MDMKTQHAIIESMYAHSVLLPTIDKTDELCQIEETMVSQQMPPDPAGTSVYSPWKKLRNWIHVKKCRDLPGVVVVDKNFIKCCRSAQ
jgi:hypothetical protein